MNKSIIKAITIVGIMLGSLATLAGLYKLIQTSNDSSNGIVYRVTDLERNVGHLQLRFIELTKERNSDHISMVKIASDVSYIKERIEAATKITIRSQRD